MSTSRASWTGRVLKERYVVGRRIGSGGMGEVYVARDETTQTDVALKLLRLSGDEAERALGRFRAEAIAASRLDHPGIVRLYDFGQEVGGPPFMVMELIRGQNLRQLLKRTGRLSVHRALRIMLQVLDALDHAHRAGVIHRDLKPSNIMILRARDARTSDVDRVKVCDFGVAKVLDPDDPEDPTGLMTLTRGGEILGSPAFMSPEQAAGGRVDARSDIFACGLVLYTLLSGEKPFASDSVVALLHQVIHSQPKPLVQQLSTLDPRVEAVVNTAMQKQPEARFRSVRAMSEALEKVLSTPQLDDADTRILSGPEEATILGIGEGSYEGRLGTDDSYGSSSGASGVGRSEASRTGSDPSGLAPSRTSGQVRATLGGGDRAWRPLAPPAPTPSSSFPWKPTLLVVLGLTVGAGAWWSARARGPSVDTLIAASTGHGFGITERMALEGFERFRDDPRALEAVASALRERRETELALLETLAFDATVALSLGPWDIEMDFNGYDATYRGRFVVEEVRVGSFTGYVDWPEHGSRVSVVGYHHGNHLMFWEDRVLLASEEAADEFRLHEKYSVYLDDDRMLGFIGMTRNRIRGKKEAAAKAAGGKR